MKTLFSFLFFESSYTRHVLLGICCQFMLVAMAKRMLGQTHSSVPYLIWAFAKNLSFYLWEWYFLLHPGYTPASFFPYVLFSFWQMFITVLLLVYTYGGDPTKTFLAVPLIETMLTTLTFPSVFVTNLMAGRSELTSFTGKFRAVDLLLPLFIFLIWKVIQKPVSFLLLRYRRWEPKHRPLILIASSAYLILATLGSMGEALYDADSRRFLILRQLIALLAIAGLAVWILLRQNEINRTSSYLQKQMNLIREHYRLLTHSRELTLRSHNLVSAQIAELTKNTDDGKEIPAEEISRYIDQLQQDWSHLEKAGFYTSDLLIDAVLSTEVYIMKSKGIRTDIQVSIQGEAVPSETVSKLLIMICEEWRENVHLLDQSADLPTFRLSITAEKSQLLITADMPGHIRRSWLRLIKGIMTTAGGSVILPNRRPWVEWLRVHTPFSSEKTRRPAGPMLAVQTITCFIPIESGS